MYTYIYIYIYNCILSYDIIFTSDLIAIILI